MTSWHDYVFVVFACFMLLLSAYKLSHRLFMVEAAVVMLVAIWYFSTTQG